MGHGDALRHTRSPVPRLHVITSDDVVSQPDFEERAFGVIAALGSRGAFHLRTRRLTGRAHVALAQRLLEASSRSGTLLVVNERVDVALAAGVPAVQLGRGAIPAACVRRIAPKLGIGVSVHFAAGTGEKPGEAEAQLAGNPTGAVPDWLLLGNVFPTNSHPERSGSGLAELGRAASRTRLPIIALGGITPLLLPRVLATGAAGVAVLSGIWGESDPEGAAFSYLSMDDAASGE